MEAPISLYFDLEPGKVADLEVVARAALAWSATIKELAFVLDPTLEIRVEVASGTTGSFSLNSIIRAIHKGVEQAKSDPVTLKAILIALAIHFGWEAIDYAFDHILDHVGGVSEETVALSPEQLDQLARQIERARDARLAGSYAQQVFREAERDPVIRGIGVTGVPSHRPAVLIPRSEFAMRAGHGEIREETIRRRVVPERQTVTLIKPVLEAGSRRWSLRSSQGEYGYTIKDTEFVARVLSGTTAIPMVAGIRMDVETETVEEFRDGVWVPSERAVTRVIGLYQPARQASFRLPREGNEPDDDGT